jgi:hypothetical protein
VAHLGADGCADGRTNASSIPETVDDVVVDDSSTSTTAQTVDDTFFHFLDFWI